MIEALVVGLSACRPDQVQTLMQFKNEFDSRSCNLSDYVNGVQCNNVNGMVTKLLLPSGCLTGTLKPDSSLFSLHHLRHLNLSYNNFTSSSLPSGFGNLNRLEVLSLSSNGFFGQVPSAISNLSMLSLLDLSHNKLTGNFPLVQNFTNLSFLKLSYNHFSGTIPPSLFMMPFLSILNLHENHLNGPIEVLNSSSSSVEYLFLGYNHFEGQILEPISKLLNLKELYLSFLNTSFPVDLRIFSSLKYLLAIDLSGIRILPASLSSDSYIPLSLEALVMSGSDINEFPSVLKGLQKLQFISISNNRIKGKVPNWLWNLPNLHTVDLVNNSLNGFEGSAEALVNSSVQMLNLGFNCFKGEFPNLPSSINFLSATHNSFTGSIPYSTCNCNSLTYLDLSYNNFSGLVLQCLSNFMVVNLRKNNLEGSLPNMFYVGTSLQTLNVGYNQLTGKLPISLLNCSSLKFLSVDNNKIEDMFPFWLKALPDLQVLILRSNKLYGPISPPHQSIFAFPELRILELSGNNFSGSLPPSYFVKWKASQFQKNEDGSIYMEYGKKTSNHDHYTYGEVIDLQYKGLYMEEAKVLTFYSAIDFSGNRFEGKIPESIGLLKALIALNLSNNAFTGHIPLSLANLKELESLDLSGNQLSGTIPKGLGTLSFLEYINVSHNQLTGEIPQGTQITGQAKSSFEENAGLCGLPLEESCFETNLPPIQHPKQEHGDEEEVLNWKAAAIGYGSGVLLGLVIGHVIASYKPRWLVKIIGLYK